MTKLALLDAEILESLIYKLANVRVQTYPFPHFYIPDIFPSDFYAGLARHVHGLQTFTGDPEGRYHGRRFAPRDTLPEGLAGLTTKRFMRAALSVFQPQAAERYGSNPMEVIADTRLIRDGKDYFIGPHTDGKWKLISLLFYLPIHRMYEQHGTSIYLPRNPKFTCEGGPHHNFADFIRIYTAPYLPNSLFGFWKTNQSFHGVEPVTQDFQRDVLLWNLYDSKSEQTCENASNAVTDAPASP